MVLTTTVKHDGTEFEIDLDALDRFGSYYVDRERGLIINASVYTHGTPDSRHLRGDVICGTDYTFEPVDIDRETVREHIRDELHVEISDDTLETAVTDSQAIGIQVAKSFDESLGGYRLLSKATLESSQQTQGSRWSDGTTRSKPSLTRSKSNSLTLTSEQSFEFCSTHCEQHHQETQSTPHE